MANGKTSRASFEIWKSRHLVVALALLVGLEVRAAGDTWAWSTRG